MNSQKKGNTKQGRVTKCFPTTSNVCWRATLFPLAGWKWIIILLHSALVLLLFLSTSLLAHAQTPAAGDAAPALRVQRWVATPVPTFTSGKVTVIEFWATWCGPCVAAFPHLNQLVEETKNDPIVFVSVTDEPEGKVRGFLAKHPLKTTVAIDESGSTFRAYKVDMIPHTVIVGIDGKIAAVTRPDVVTAQMLRDVAAGRAVNLPVVKETEPDMLWDRRANLPANSLAQVLLLPSQATSSMDYTNVKIGKIGADGVNAKRLLTLAYGAEGSLIRGSIPVSEDRYRVVAQSPDKNLDTARLMLRTIVDQALSITARWETEEHEVLVLRRAPGVALHLVVSKEERGNGMGRPGRVEGKGQTAEWMARMIGLHYMGIAGIDETNLAGRYDVVMDWTPDDMKSLSKAVLDLGLEVRPEKRKIRVLVIGPKKNEAIK